jgi:hypothetical protein
MNILLAVIRLHRKWTCYYCYHRTLFWFSWCSYGKSFESRSVNMQLMIFNRNNIDAHVSPK